MRFRAFLRPSVYNLQRSVEELPAAYCISISLSLSPSLLLSWFLLLSVMVRRILQLLHRHPCNLLSHSVDNLFLFLFLTVFLDQNNSSIPIFSKTSQLGNALAGKTYNFTQAMQARYDEIRPPWMNEIKGLFRNILLHESVKTLRRTPLWS